MPKMAIFPTVKKRKRKSRPPMTRSQMMRAVRSEDTKPEVLVRRALFRAGLRYRLHRHDLPGSPDLFILRYNVVVFVNGCFWHQHGCKFTSRPKSNPEFWNEIREQRGARREDGLEALAHGVPRGDGLGMFRQERFCPHGGAPCGFYPGRRGICRNLAPRKNYN